MNKKRVALALAAALGINTLIVTVGQVGEQITVAHAQNARLVGDQVKLLDGISIKSLSTEVEISSTGEALISFTDIKKENIKNVKVSEAFKHEVFTERKDIDTPVSTTIDGTWDSSTGKLKLNSKITQPGIYTGKVEIEFTDGTKETYTVSLRRTPSDSVKFTTTVGVGTVEVSGLVLNNGAGDTAHTFAEADLELKNTRTGMTAKAKAGTSAGSFVFSALDLTSNGKLQENDVLELKVTYGVGNEYTLTSEILLVKQEKPVITNAFVTNSTADLAKLATTVDADFGVNGASTGSFVGGKNQYDVTAGGKTILTYEQTIINETGGTPKVGGAQITAATTVSGVDLTLGTLKAYSSAAVVDNFAPNYLANYGANTAQNQTVSTGYIGNYNFNIGGTSLTYFDAMSGLTPTVSGTGADAANAKRITFVKSDATESGLPTTTDFESSANGKKVSLDLSSGLEHGYKSVVGTFEVDYTADKTAIEDKNREMKAVTVNSAVEATFVSDAANSVNVSLVVAADTLDGAYTQAKFEQTSASEGKITLVGGKSIVGTSTDLNTVKLTVGGATASIIGSESAGNDLVFSVQFNGQVPTTIDWSLAVGSASKVKGTLETGVLESTNIKSVKATNSGTSNIKDQFTVEAKFNLDFPNSTTKVTVDGLDSDRVTLEQFKTGEHTVNIKSETGKYQGTYKAGVMVTQQPFTIVAKDAKSTSNTSASLVVDANFFTTDDIAKVTGGVVQYSEKTTSGSTTTWSDWKDSTTKVEKSEVKEDAITKTVSGLTGGKTYKFRVVYDYNNGTTTEKVYSNETAEVTLPTSSSSSTITGSGGTTTGTSTGSTTITVTTSNSTLTGTSASVTLPSGFRYDSGKTPVAVTFKYKDKNGKIVTETKEQYSNVTARFNGNNVELNGLVPGKDYNEITVDYTDNNGKTRSIILKNVKTTSQTQVETYLANVYEVVFGRPADEAGYHFHLDNLKNKKVSLRDFLLNMLTEKEFVEKYKSTEEKIEALYNAIVNRTSDEAGKKFWVDEYKKVLAVYGSETTALKAIADRMVNENELKELADKMGVQW